MSTPVACGLLLVSCAGYRTAIREGRRMTGGSDPVRDADRTAETAKIGASDSRRSGASQRRTLEEVAEASGLTKGFLSKIERDLACASVAALLRICATLDIPLSSLFENDSTGEVVRAGQYPPDRLRRPGSGGIPADPARRAAGAGHLLRDRSPAGGSGNEGYSLPAEVEFVYVVSGQARPRLRRAHRRTRPGRRLHLRSGRDAHLPRRGGGRHHHRAVGAVPGAGRR